MVAVASGTYPVVAILAFLADHREAPAAARPSTLSASASTTFDWCRLHQRAIMFGRQSRAGNDYRDYQAARWGEPLLCCHRRKMEQLDSHRGTPGLGAYRQGLLRLRKLRFQDGQGPIRAALSHRGVSREVRAQVVRWLRSSGENWSPDTS
jgi:hypothetical protein